MKRKTRNDRSTLVSRVCVMVVVVLLGGLVSQAATVDLDGTVFTGSSYNSPLGTTTIDLTGDTGNEDWVFIGLHYPNTSTAEVYAANSKIGGVAFTNIVTTWEDPNTNATDILLKNAEAKQAVKFIWDDGSQITNSAVTGTGVPGFAITPNPFEVKNVRASVLEFEVTLSPPHDYRLATYAADQRFGTEIEIWDDEGDGMWKSVSSEAVNDATNVRIHNILVTNLTTEATYKFRFRAWRSTNSTTAGLRNFAGMSLERIIPPVPDGTIIMVQ